MPQTTDTVVAEYAISRADQDRFALRSQSRWAAARAAGICRDEITPVTMPQRRGDPVPLDTYEHPRPDMTLPDLARLRGISGADLSVTAGNASGCRPGPRWRRTMAPPKATGGCRQHRTRCGPV